MPLMDKKTSEFVQGLDFLRFLKGKPRNTKEKPTVDGKKKSPPRFLVITRDHVVGEVPA